MEHTATYTKRPPGNAWAKAEGRFVLTLSADGKNLTGTWYNNNGGSGVKHLILRTASPTQPRRPLLPRPVSTTAWRT